MDKELSFEEALKGLEEVVESLERGDLTLDQSLDFFEKGVGLTKFCSDSLEKAEGKIEIIKEEAGKSVIEEFNYSNEGEE
ncbi:exodeoxyribonuclease VII small subunit [Halonatronum saccharophilum]|uniref:exodeoxyribonuclease VII small subunit n=1 Tax=Halonatronum saccharophilum TaxID=150060 RepID=UPI0004807595|nr:exodeoxyribonuclease VII small subunit [Halonatronum saccharophilum]